MDVILPPPPPPPPMGGHVILYEPTKGAPPLTTQIPNFTKLDKSKSPKQQHNNVNNNNSENNNPAEPQTKDMHINNNGSSSQVVLQTGSGGYTNGSFTSNGYQPQQQQQNSLEVANSVAGSSGSVVKLTQEGKACAKVGPMINGCVPTASQAINQVPGPATHQQTHNNNHNSVIQYLPPPHQPSSCGIPNTVPISLHHQMPCGITNLPLPCGIPPPGGISNQNLPHPGGIANQNLPPPGGIANQNLPPQGGIANQNLPPPGGISSQNLPPSCGAPNQHFPPSSDCYILPQNGAGMVTSNGMVYYANYATDQSQQSYQPVSYNLIGGEYLIGSNGAPEQYSQPPPIFDNSQSAQASQLRMMCIYIEPAYNGASGPSYPMGDGVISTATGPATVRMVSNNGPPLPMPMQPAPGHMVQQIVDENGVLTHVILSSQPSPHAQGGPPPMPGAAHSPMYHGPHNGGAGGPMFPGPGGGGAGAGGAGYGSQYPPHFAPGPPPPSNGGAPPPPYPGGPAATSGGGHPHHHHPPPPHHHHHPHHHGPHPGGMGGPSPPPPQAHSHGNHYGPGSDNPTRNRLQKRLRAKQQGNKCKEKDRGKNNENYLKIRDPPHRADDEHSSGSSLDGNELYGEDVARIKDTLSKTTPPSVSDVCARSALISFQPVDLSALELACRALTGTVRHHLSLSNKSRDKSIFTYSVDAEKKTDLKLRDLKPASEYHLRVCSQYVDPREKIDVKGDQSELVDFKTLSCEPDKPLPPKLSHKTKTSITLKWNQIGENVNGGKFVSFTLEVDGGQPLGGAPVPSNANISSSNGNVGPSNGNITPSNGVNSSDSAFNYNGGHGDAPVTNDIANSPNHGANTFANSPNHGANTFTEVYNGPNRQYRLNKLQPATRYTFRLAAINSIGKSDHSDPIMFCTSGSAPSQPEAPTLTDCSCKALTLAWMKRPTDDEFTLQMEDQETGHGFLTVYHGGNLIHKIKNLRRNTEYKFRLQATNEEGKSQWSDSVAFRTSAMRPQPPSRPQLKGREHSTSFKVTWDPPRDNGGVEITKYQLELDAGQGFMLRYEGEQTECVCDQLLPGYTYSVRARAYNGSQWSENSESAQICTQAVAPGQCNAPRLHGKARASTLNLRWSYPEYDGGSGVTSYDVLMTLSDNTTRVVYSGADTDCVVASLLPGRHYLFQVRALNAMGAGGWSDCLSLVSGPGVPDAPRVPCVHCKSAQQCVVEWEEPLNNGATVNEYKLEWLPPAQNDYSQVYSGGSLRYETRSLQPASLYYFRVQALNSAGAGPFSPIASLTTPCAPPGAVVGLRASATAESIHLTWKEPAKNGSEICAYNIDVGEQYLIDAGCVLEYCIENLMPETLYRVRVQAVNGEGAGPFTSALRVTTHPRPPGPPSLECVSTAPNSLKLKWGDKNPDQLDYCLEMKKNNSFYPVYQGPLQTHKLSRLQEVTQYEFRINARNKAGDGPYSASFYFHTSRAPPPAVKEPHVTDISRDTCQVIWPAVKGPGGRDRVEYSLQVQSSDSPYKEVYRGDSTSHRLSSLHENSEYQVRVCAHRLTTTTTYVTPPPVSAPAKQVEAPAKTPAISATSPADATHSSENSSETSSLSHTEHKGGNDKPENEINAHNEKQADVTNTVEHNSEEDNDTESTKSQTDELKGVESEKETKDIVTSQPVVTVTSLTGAFSPGVTFRTKRPEVANAKEHNTLPSTGTGSERRSERRQMSDKQWATILLVAFSVFAVIVACLAQQIIAYTNGGSAIGGGGGSSVTGSGVGGDSNDSLLP